MITDKKASQHSLTYVTVTALLCLFTIGVSAFSGKNVQSDKAAERAAKIVELRSVLHNEQLRKAEPERVYKAMEELGREKADEAIPELIQLLTFEKQLGPDLGDFRITTPSARYPAVSALYEIGESALPALIEVIETQDEDSVASQNALYSINAILVRKSPADAINFLEGAAARSTSTKAALRLSKAADKTKKLLTKKLIP